MITFTEFTFSHFQNGEKVGYIRVSKNGKLSKDEALEILREKYDGEFKLSAYGFAYRYNEPFEGLPDIPPDAELEFVPMKLLPSSKIKHIWPKRKAIQ